MHAYGLRHACAPGGKTESRLTAADNKRRHPDGGKDEVMKKVKGDEAHAPAVKAPAVKAAGGQFVVVDCVKGGRSREIGRAHV